MRKFLLLAMLLVAAPAAMVWYAAPLLGKNPALRTGNQAGFDAGENAAKTARGADSRTALNADPGFPWGVVATNSACYDQSMRRLGMLAGGTPVEAVSRKYWPDAALVECKVLRKRVWQDRTVWIREGDLVLFDGETYAEADADERDTAIDYFTALGTYERERAKAEPKRARNPFAAEYENAKAEYDALLGEISQTLEKVRYSNTHELPGGAVERGQLLTRANELRVMQREMTARFEPIRDKWQQWEDENASPASPPQAPSPAMVEARNTLRTLQPQMRRIAPGFEPALD